MNAKKFSIAALFLLPIFIKVNTGEDVIKLMYKKYAGKWYRSMTFDQTTEIYRDTSKKIQTWHESVLNPDKLRIDVAPAGGGNTYIMRNDSTYSIANGVLQSASAQPNDLIFLLGGMYFYPVDQTIAIIKKQGYDVTKLSEDTLNGKRVYIIGASDKSEQVNQLWVDKNDLYLVRIIKYNKNNKQDAIFENYIKIGNAGTETKVRFSVNGKLRQVETYYNCKLAPDIDSLLFDPRHFQKISYKN
jgi:outer membrane lipoprotein-sorting protein